MLSRAGSSYRIIAGCSEDKRIKFMPNFSLSQREKLLFGEEAIGEEAINFEAG